MSTRSMIELRDSFPSLLHKGFDPDRFRPEELADFCKSPAVTSGSGHAAKFLLSVWSGPSPLTLKDGQVEVDEWRHLVEVDEWRWPWQVLPFDVQGALASWDQNHRAAFLAWVQDPWWP